MANEGRNILEAVLNGDIASKFNKVDTAVETMQKHMDMASESAKNLANEFANLNEVLGKSFNAEGATQYIDKILQLTNTLSGFGTTTTRVATESVDNINEITRALQQLYKDKLNLEGKMTGMEIKSLGKESVSVEVLEIYQKLKRELDEVNKKIEETSKKLDDNGEAAQKAYDVQKVRQTIALEIKRSDAIDKTNAAIEKMNQKLIGLEGGAKPQTIEQYRIAIKNLKRELEQLAPTDKTGIDAINSKIKEYQELIDVATGKQRKFSLSMNELTDSAKRLASVFGVMLSVQGLINFATNIRDVTGEFELQHRALQAIIGDMEEANKLWDKTIRLAVKSPYSVKELVTYTKQLAAYRIETEKLYDTTKMLADISSGLGVDMQRLILAYGQVKAANYLRGQELRQFSEAGINILGGLADYFSELQNRAISTADVFDMVSKRMVKFEDVAEVLKRMTQEGGIFFNMQEIQAETLKGKMMNLKDSFDIMLNSIGESNRGIFVWMIDTAKYVVDNWQTIANTLKWVGGILGFVAIAAKSLTIKMAVLAAEGNINNITMRGLSGTLARLIVAFNGATLAAHGFSTALKSIPVIGWILAALSMLIGLLTSIRGHMRKVREEEERFTKSTQDLREKIATTKSYSSTITALTEERKKLLEVENRTEEQNKRLSDIEEERSETIKKLANINPQYAKTVKGLKDDVEALVLAEKEELDTLRAILALRQILGSDEMTQTIQKYNDAVDAVDNATASLQNNRREISNYIYTTDKAGNVTSAFYDEIADIIHLTEDEDLSTFRNAIKESVDEFGSDVDNMATFSDRYEKFVNNINSAYKELVKGKAATADQYESEISLVYKISNAYNRLQRANEEFLTSQQNLGIAIDNVIDKYTAYDEFINITAAFENATSEEEKRAVQKRFVKFWGDILDGLKIEGSARQEFEKKIIDALGGAFKLESFTLPDAKILLRGWQYDFNNALIKLNQDYRKTVQKLALENNANAPEITLFEIKDPAKQLEALQGDISKEIKRVEAYIKSYSVPGQVTITKKDYEAAVQYLKALNKAYSLAGGIDKTSGKTAIDMLNKRIDLIKRLNTEYKKYVDLGVKDPFAKTLEDMQSEIKELDLTAWIDSLTSKDFKDETIVKAFENSVLTPMVDAAGQAGKIAAAKFKSGYGYAIDKSTMEEEKANLKKKLEEMLADYDVWKDVKKMGIGEDVASALGIKTASLQDIRESFEKLFNGIEGDFKEVGGEFYKWYQEQLAKISQMEDKEQVERLKTYLEYTKKGLNERAKIMYNGLMGLAEIEKAYQTEIDNARKKGDDEQIARLEKQKETVMANYREQLQQQLDTQAFKDFKGSDMYIKMFQDLDYTSGRVLKAMRDRVEELKSSLKDLSPSDLKAIEEQLQKIDQQIISRNSAREFDRSVSWKRMFGIGETATAKQYISAETDLSKYQEELDAINAIIAAKEAGASIDEDLAAKHREYASMDIADLKKEKTTKEQSIQTTQQTVDSLGEELKAYDRLRRTASSFNKDIKSMQSSIMNMASAMEDAYEALGNETNNTSKAFVGVLDSILSIMAALPMYIAGMTAAGVAVNSAMGIIGLIAEAIQLTLTLISALAGMNDAGIQDNIDSMQRSVDALKDKYDELEKAFKRAWNVEDMLHYRQEMKRTLEQQAKYYEQMAKAESSKKKADQDKINEYYKKAKEAEDAIKAMEEDFIEALGGIGKDNYRSAAQEFVDSWYDAFKETGDGLDGLTEHFEEVLVNMIKKQAMMRIAQRYLQPLFDMIDSSIDTDGKITVSEMNLIRQKIQETMPQLNEALKDFFESLGELGGIGEGLSGLQEGIQGVTEETAEVVAAYLNSLRLFVSQTTVDVGRIAEILSTTSGTINPMLGELKLIKERMDDTYNFLYNRREGGNGSIQVSIVN